MRERDAEILKAVGDLIRDCRKKKITQEQLGRAADVSYEHVNHIENYRRMPSLEVIARLGRALGYERPSAFLACDRSGVL